MKVEKENTFRALKDQPLLENNPWRCRFGWHKWTRWTDPKKTLDSIYIRQGRYCIACNHYDERKL